MTENLEALKTRWKTQDLGDYKNFLQLAEDLILALVAREIELDAIIVEQHEAMEQLSDFKAWTEQTSIILNKLGEIALANNSLLDEARKERRGEQASGLIIPSTILKPGH